MRIDELNKRLAEADSWDDLSREEKGAVMKIKDHLVSWVNKDVIPVTNEVAGELQSAFEPLGEWKKEHPELFEDMAGD